MDLAARPPDPPALVQQVPAREYSIDLELSSVFFLSPGLQPSALSAGLVERTRSRRGLEASLGLRVLMAREFAGGAAAELWTGVGLAPRFGAWRPRVGVQLGLTGAQRFAADSTRVAPGNDLTLRLVEGPVYLAFEAAPARFQFGSVQLSLVQFAVGTDVWNAGRVVRVQFTALELGWSFR